ncbi:unnamed protein product [Pieris brassicae]|uniref:Cuticle protein n=1 Tax=Pieris brassicae TaxID=7116 RepID=A0A9P0SH33_PIEBR|nr:unnamed protein product [Pieris brassicae]
MFVKAAVILSVVAVAAAGVVHLGHGYAGEGYGHESVAYAPVAHGGYEAHDQHIDYHVSIAFIADTSKLYKRVAVIVKG